MYSTISPLLQLTLLIVHVNETRKSNRIFLDFVTTVSGIRATGQRKCVRVRVFVRVRVSVCTCVFVRVRVSVCTCVCVCCLLHTLEAVSIVCRTGKHFV